MKLFLELPVVIRGFVLPTCTTNSLFYDISGRGYLVIDAQTYMANMRPSTVKAGQIVTDGFDEQ